MVRSLRNEAKISLPINSHILIALSGGPDSTALAHLLIHYGRRVVPKKNITLLHVDHAWRSDSKNEALQIKEWARAWGVPFICRRLPVRLRPAAARRAGLSIEAAAREGRKKIFADVAARVGATWVLTAHQADDVAETVLWRMATAGAIDSGILRVHGCELRPLLDVWKAELYQYLKEVKQSSFEDPSNHEAVLLRGAIRSQCWPALERVFPRVKQHLHALGKKQRQIDVARGPC